MTSKRKFYKTIIYIEVLSEEPYAPKSLEDVTYDITQGHCSGEWTVKSTKEVGGRAMANALLAQRSDPEFFMLDEKGNDTEEYESD